MGPNLLGGDCGDIHDSFFQFFCHCIDLEGCTCVLGWGSTPLPTQRVFRIVFFIDLRGCTCVLSWGSTPLPTQRAFRVVLFIISTSLTNVELTPWISFLAMPLNLCILFCVKQSHGRQGADLKIFARRCRLIPSTELSPPIGDSSETGVESLMPAARPNPQWLVSAVESRAVPYSHAGLWGNTIP